jgi:ribosomal protein L44E
MMTVGALALLATGCQDTRRTETQRIEYVHETGPNTLATIERMQTQVLDKLGGMQREILDRQQKAQEDAQHRCWMEGNRNCSGLGRPSYGPIMSRRGWW